MKTLYNALNCICFIAASWVVHTILLSNPLQSAYFWILFVLILAMRLLSYIEGYTEARDDKRTKN